ncbi:class II glutamine amidotransferase [Thermoleophilum album]|uniref:class II glutamine amidotransferase n=1 Tax=Thermoleophilum album TaxID=29539 RepID=UPI00237CD916|nr:class II glutamine amidotransferase [Thermoleophilum album]WDT92777.1 class II glutamine amidotransferase [Thermoleophilum album]
MCRLLGSVSVSPHSLAAELLDAPNALLRQADEHDSGFGLAVYPRADGGDPGVVRFPQAGAARETLHTLAGLRGRIFHAHVRRATIGGLRLENTHPFTFGAFSFSHNGTLAPYPQLPPDAPSPRGDTDSERLFALLLSRFDARDPLASLRSVVVDVIATTAFSALNFLFCDGERLYAYRLGIFELYWLARDGQLLLASEPLTEESWHPVQQDVLLIADAEDPSELHAERLVGDIWRDRARIERLELNPALSGEARGAAAAERARALATRSSQ